MKACLVTKVRDEGIYLLEWIAYHKDIGFDDIIVISNDLTDGSDMLLEALHNSGTIIWKDVTNIPLKETNIGGRAYKEAFKIVSDLDCDWVMELDADEFLDLNGKDLNSFLNDFNKSDIIVFNWMNFGCSGQVNYDDEKLIIERFDQHLPAKMVDSSNVKTISRKSRIKELACHVSRFNEGVVNISHSSGKEYLAKDSEEAVNAVYRNPVFSVNYTAAKVRHYTTKSVEEYLLRMKRGLGGVKKAGDNPKYNFSYFVRRNKSFVKTPISPDVVIKTKKSIDDMVLKFNFSEVVLEVRNKTTKFLSGLKKDNLDMYNILYAYARQANLPTLEEAVELYFVNKRSPFYQELIIHLFQSDDKASRLKKIKHLEESDLDDDLFALLKKNAS